MVYKCGKCGSVRKYRWCSFKIIIKCNQCKEYLFFEEIKKLKILYFTMFVIFILLETMVCISEFSSLYYRILSFIHILFIFYAIFVIIEIQICKKQEVDMPGLGDKRDNIKPGLKVKVVQKQDQRSGKLTEGVVLKLLTNSPTHPHGIKVMLEGGIVGRVKEIIG